MSTVILYFFIILAAGSALGVLLVRNVLYAALLLIICLLCLAGLYILLHAEFLAITQIMIYAGGILILLIFGIMLTIKKEGKPLEVGSQNMIAGSLVGLGFLFILIYSFGTASLSFPQHPLTKANNITEVGISMMSDYVAPFELAGILLLITLIGASIMSSVKKHG